MAAKIDDELLEQIALIAPRDQIVDRLRERYEGLVDRISLMAPFAPDSDMWSDIVRGLQQAGDRQ